MIRLQVTAVLVPLPGWLACAPTVKTPGILPPTNQIPPGPGMGDVPVLSTLTWMGEGSAPGAIEKVTCPRPKIRATLSTVVANVALIPGYTLFSFTAPNIGVFVDH